MKRTGFTFIEILVVITIIAVLTAIGVVSYSSMQKNSRDARRKGDMKTIQNAFEQYYSDNAGKYPTTELQWSPYLPGKYPTDPKESNPPYESETTETAYCICATLESLSGNSDTSCAFVASGTGAFYCVKSLQR